MKRQEPPAVRAHFGEDKRMAEDTTAQSNLNIFRKASINLIRLYKTGVDSKKAIAKICLTVSSNLCIF